MLVGAQIALGVWRARYAILVGRRAQIDACAVGGAEGLQMEVAVREIDEQRVGNDAVRQPRRRGHIAPVKQVVTAVDDGPDRRVVLGAPIIEVVLTGFLIDDVIAHPEFEIHVAAAVFNGVADTPVRVGAGIPAAVVQRVVIDFHGPAALSAEVGLPGDVDAREIPAAVGWQRTFAHAINNVVVDLDLALRRVDRRNHHAIAGDVMDQIVVDHDIVLVPTGRVSRPAAP